MATWTGITGRQRSRHSVQALTESAPSVPTDGVDLSACAAVIPVIRAPAGQTLTGTGAIRWYIYITALGRWVKSPRGDDDVVELAGLSEGALPALLVTSPGGRGAWVFDNLGVTGGTAPELDIFCMNRAGEEI